MVAQEEEQRIAAEPPTPPPPAYRLKSLNTLAFAKGKLPRCEMTGLPATVECVTPHITLYFASKEYALDAWHGIMHKISPLLGPLRASSASVGTEEDRAKREYTAEMGKKALVDICTQEASKFLAAKRFELAVPGALQALIFLKELYGDGAVETIAPLLQLAKANLGLGRHEEAEECLRRASRNVEKQNPDSSNHVRSLLHRNLGLLYVAQDKLDKALAELSHDVYCSSLEMGPEHVETSIAYFHLGSVFYAQHKIENALAFYDKFVDIWHKFLVGAASSSDESRKTRGDDPQLQEAAEMLTHVLGIRVKLLGPNHIASAEAKYTIGLLLYAYGEDDEDTAAAAERQDEARSKIQEALEAYTEHLGPEHPSTLVVKNVLDSMPPPKMTSTADRVTAFGAQGEDDDDDNFAALSSHFPADMARAAPQSPIPLVPASVAGGL